MEGLGINLQKAIKYASLNHPLGKNQGPINITQIQNQALKCGFIIILNCVHSKSAWHHFSVSSAFSTKRKPCQPQLVFCVLAVCHGCSEGQLQSQGARACLSSVTMFKVHMSCKSLLTYMESPRKSSRSFQRNQETDTNAMDRGKWSASGWHHFPCPQNPESGLEGCQLWNKIFSF